MHYSASTPEFGVAWRSIAKAETSVHVQIIGKTSVLQYLANSINLFLIKITHRSPMQHGVSLSKAIESVELNSLPNAISLQLFGVVQIMKTFLPHQL